VLGVSVPTDRTPGESRESCWDVGYAISCYHGDVTFAECYSLVRFH